MVTKNGQKLVSQIEKELGLHENKLSEIFYV